MLPDLDDTLRQLLIHEMPISEGEVDIAFDQPTREWSARLGGKPTLNLFLYDIRENTRLRQAASPWERTVSNKDGLVGERRKAVRFDVHYMLTVWSGYTDNAHYLTARALMALLRVPCLSESVLKELFDDDAPAALLDQPAPITLQVAQNDVLEKPTDIWSVLSNDMRPAIPITATLAINPFMIVETPLVREMQRHTTQRGQRTYAAMGFNAEISGCLISTCYLINRQVRLLEHNEIVPVTSQGDFRIANLTAGEYTLVITADNLKAPVEWRLVVPSKSYDVMVDCDKEPPSVNQQEPPKAPPGPRPNKRSSSTKKGV
jgi:hypothetical protein